MSYLRTTLVTEMHKKFLGGRQYYFTFSLHLLRSMPFSILTHRISPCNAASAFLHQRRFSIPTVEITPQALPGPLGSQKLSCRRNNPSDLCDITICSFYKHSTCGSRCGCAFNCCALSCVV